MIKKKSGNVYYAKNLKVNHLGFKGSVGASNYEKQNADNLRNWHYMWSSFYFYKKNYNYLYALYQMFGKFIKSLIKLFFYSVTFQKNKKEKYLYRFLGLYNSFLNYPSHFREKK